MPGEWIEQLSQYRAEQCNATINQGRNTLPTMSIGRMYRKLRGSSLTSSQSMPARRDEQTGAEENGFLLPPSNAETWPVPFSYLCLDSFSLVFLLWPRGLRGAEIAAGRRLLCLPSFFRAIDLS